MYKLEVSHVYKLEDKRIKAGNKSHVEAGRPGSGN
jgi:hypothetical protein